MTDAPITQIRPQRITGWGAFVAPVRPYLPQSIEGKILAVIFMIIALWAVAILSFGLPALLIPMKLIVPALVLALVVLTWSM